MVVCSICLEVVSSPCCCVPCGHLFCRDCIEAWSLNTRECPDCRTQIHSVQTIFGLAEENHTTGENNIHSSLYQQTSQLLERIPTQKCWISLFVVFSVFILLWLVIDLNSCTSCFSYIIHSAVVVLYALFSFSWSLIKMAFTFLINLLKFPFHFVSNLPEYCESVSTFVSHAFWFIIYIFLIVFIVWYCAHTISITKARKEWKLKRKKH